MLLDRGIATKHMMYYAVRLSFRTLNGLLLCVLFIQWLINYLSIIKEIFDIVSRAVNAYRDIFPPPQLEQINTTIEHTRISLFDNVSKVLESITIAIVSQNANSAVHFLVCRKIFNNIINSNHLGSEVNYA